MMGRIDKVVVEEHVASISHDLKNPLSVIALDVQNLQDHFADQAPPDARSALRRIARNIAFMDRMIRELLDLSAIESHRLSLHRERVDLARLLTDVIDRSVAPRDRARLCVDARIPAPVNVDVMRIERVVTNLVDNALAYAPALPVVVRLDTDDRLARVSVVDLGPGLTQRELASLFAKHYRLQATARCRHGVGLGLYISRRIVEAHEGRITAASRAGHGSTFAFTLPLYAD